MKAPVTLCGDRTRARRDDRRKAVRLARVVEAMAASVLQDLVERGQPTGRFFWDGLTGDFATSPLVSTLVLRSTHGTIRAQARLRNDDWALSITATLPDDALRGVYDRLHGLLNQISHSGIEMTPTTVH